MLQKLISEIDKVESFPVEVTEIRDAIIALGVQDRIIFCPDEKMNSETLRGTYYQYTHRNALYGDPSFVSLIVYCSKLPIEWQRIVCCKEMVHILDDAVEQTKTEEDLEGMLSRLLGPMSTEDFGICDIMAAKDHLALYQALPLLFPMSMRARAIRSGLSHADIARRAVIPETFVSIVLSEEWPALVKDLVF